MGNTAKSQELRGKGKEPGAEEMKKACDGCFAAQECSLLFK